MVPKSESTPPVIPLRPELPEVTELKIVLDKVIQGRIAALANAGYDLNRGTSDLLGWITDLAIEAIEKAWDARS